MLLQALRRVQPSMKAATQVAAVAATGFAVLLAAGLLAVRFWLWPSIPQWHGELQQSVQTALTRHGLSIQMGSIIADWETWYRPRLSVHQLALSQADGTTVLSIGEVQATLGIRSLASLWHWQPVFSEIRLSDTSMAVQRDADGEIRVAGFVVGAATTESSVLDWLFRQGRLRLDSGSVTWRDEARHKSVQLNDITLALNNFGPRHAWALRATPPGSLGEGFVLQGNFRHPWFGVPSDLMGWTGEAFVQFDRVDLAELFGFVHLPDQAPLKVNSGQGALRAWAQVSASALEDLTVDLDLTNASLQWGLSKRPMTLQQLTGRVQTRLSAKRQWVSMTNMNLRSAQLSEPMQIPAAELDVEQLGDVGEFMTRVTANRIDLVPAIWLAENLPLPVQWKSTLTELQPRGVLTDLKLGWTEASGSGRGFSLQSGFKDLTLTPGAKRPGFASLTGSLKATEDGGELRLDSTSSVLHFPGVFENPALAFDRIDAEFTWTSKNILPSETSTAAPRVEVAVRKLNVSNSDLELQVTGSHDWSGKGAGETKLEGRVVRADPVSIFRYVPIVAGRDTRAWLKDSLLASKPYNATFTLAGDLDRFPFREPDSGRFVVNARTSAARLRPGPGWPVISNIHADVVFERAQFRINAKNAQIGDLSLSEVVGRIDDLEAARPVLAIDGALSGDFQRVLDTAAKLPLKSRWNDMTSDMTGKGQVGLALAMKLDLDNSERSSVSGKFSMGRGLLHFSPTLPEIALTSANLAFDENGIGQVDIQGQALGGMLRAVTRPADKPGNPTVIVIEGQASAAGLEHWLSDALGVSMKDSFSGSARYDLTFDPRTVGSQVTVTSSLEGLGMDVFGPFKKSAKENWGLRIDVTQVAAKGKSPASQSWVVTSNQQKLNARISRGLSQNQETTIDLDSRTMAGQFRWIPSAASSTADTKTKNSRQASVLQGRLARLWLDKPRPEDDVVDEKNASDSIAQDWPSVDLTVDDFRVGERNWGRLEVQASPAAASRSWDIQRFVVSNPDGEFSGQGQWAMQTPVAGKRRSRTALNIELQVKNGGALLSRSGYPGVVKGTEGKIEGKLNWAGSPLDFSGRALNGNLVLNLSQGQFLKAEPGIARLVGVLNLQSLPSRIKLDFRDVFSEGFAYERIRGDLQFLNGRVNTQNLRIVGVQASVLLEGTADIRTETQDLRVLVLPEVNAGLYSLGYAALVNPAIGLGAFVAQYILRNPVRELLSYEYRVTGPWADPVVESVKRER